MYEWLAWISVLLLSYMLAVWYWRQYTVSDIPRKWVIITGCDTGFGNSLARRLDALGFNVVATCLTVTGQDDVKRQCSGRVHPCYMDVKRPESVQKALAFVTGLIPPGQGLWGLVNNAGIPGVASGPLEWLQTADFREVMEVNTLGLIDVTLAFLPLLKKAKGRVVCMSSASGRRLAGPLALPYDISKCAVEAFSDGLRRHLRLYGFDVSVHIIEPGIFHTPMHAAARHRDLLENTWARLGPTARHEFGESFFREYVRRVLAVVERVGGRDVSPVMDVCVDALTSRAPRLRYPAGYDACLFSVPMSYLPSAAVDWIMCKLTPAIRPANSS